MIAPPVEAVSAEEKDTLAAGGRVVGKARAHLDPADRRCPQGAVDRKLPTTSFVPGIAHRSMQDTGQGVSTTLRQSSCFLSKIS